MIPQTSTFHELTKNRKKTYKKMSEEEKNVVILDRFSLIVEL